MNRTFTWVACLLLAVSGCSGKRDPRELLGPGGEGVVVVDARLLVGDAFPTISLSTTQSPDVPFDDDLSALSGAVVTLTTGASDTVFYQEHSAGRYWRYDGTVADEVQPHTTYHLHVRTPDGHRVKAETTTPDSFHVREWLLVDETSFAVRRELGTLNDYYQYPDTVNQLIYQDGIVEARFDRGNAIGFQMALFNLESNSPLLIDADFLDEADKESLERQSSSPALDAPDGFVRLPWLAVWYEGRHRFVVYSVDRNWYDLARSIRFYGPSGIGFGSNAGDDFERPIFHIEGGIGLFGSAALDETILTVWPRP